MRVNEVYGGYPEHCIGYRCGECNTVVPAMWGNICDGCREKERRHRELIAALKEQGAQEKQREAD